ncbi:hypothetical protein E2P81_ATG01720 [Venturia nashicola]|uniref:Uncharacterized protein n=1 Tax=Venturia nashicola TaxID=86259 RepID=A0A4Z1NT42_9PEZI|nr:hypothetical protein E6O75_ATG01763 [Venturia nashicola]TLD18992.1 hypothetical protein E2P81_ATG01720 [Venturia nashicola]
MGKRPYNAFKDEQIEQAKRRKLNPPPNAPVGPKAMNGITRTAMEQQQLVTSFMPQNYLGLCQQHISEYPVAPTVAPAIPASNSCLPATIHAKPSLSPNALPTVRGAATAAIAQQMPNPQQHYTPPPPPPQSYAGQQFVQSPSSQQGGPRKRKMQQAQSMSPAFKKYKSNSTNTSAPQIRNRHSAEKPPSLQSTVTSTSIPSSSVEPPNGIPDASKPQYAAPNLQTQGQHLAENIPSLLSTLTGISIPTSCAEPSDVIPNDAMLPLLVEYAHLLFQKNVDDFGKIFDLMTEAMQQEMIRKTEEEGLRGFAEQVAKYAMWQIISFSQLNQGNSVIFQKASFFINKVRTNRHGDDEVEAEEDYVINTSDVQIGLPLQFGSSCAPAFTAMIEAMHNTIPLGKVQCCKCRKKRWRNFEEYQIERRSK